LHEHPHYGKLPLVIFMHEMDLQVVLENSNVAKLASPQYLSVHSLPQEDCYDTDDASAREIYPILVPQSTIDFIGNSVYSGDAELQQIERQTP
jgi:hypothetical protein